MIPPSNNPDLAVAQEWFAQLDAWIQTHGLRGYDPFDVKQHALLRAAQSHALPRKATTALCDCFPNLIRRVLRTQPTENPKAHALAALGGLRIFERFDDPAHLERALVHLRWLRHHASPGYHGPCWGYPFHIAAKGLETSPNTPVGVVTAIAAEAFLEAHRLTGEQRHLDTARGIADFFLEDLPRLDTPNGAHCFAYTPSDRRRVHNANLLACECLLTIAAAANDAALAEAALPALRFTLRRQREDGAWPYGDANPRDPYEPELLGLVDHHHTGFVLRSLDTIQNVRPDDAVLDALERGYRYYEKNLLTPNGIPLNEYARYPIDIHACAEAILCHSRLAPRYPRAQRHATAALRWAFFHMRNPKNGVPHYRKYPMHTAKLSCPRWGAAWIYRALAEYLHQFS